MIDHISIPDNTVKLQYATQCDGYEQWDTLEFGDIVDLQSERKGGKDTDVLAKGGRGR